MSPERGQPDARLAWREYEEQIYRHLKEIAGDQGTVDFDQRKPGKYSGVSRQVDVWVTGPFAGGVEDCVTAAVDCKHFSVSINVKHVEAFMGLVDDVDADLGVMISSSGFTPAARRRARQRGFRLHEIAKLELVEFSEWEDWIPWEPSESEHEPELYVGDFYDHEPYGDAGASVQYTGDDGPAGILSGPEVHWGDDDARRDVLAAILEHALGHRPDSESVEMALVEFGEGLHDGHPFELDAAAVAHIAY